MRSILLFSAAMLGAAAPAFAQDAASDVRCVVVSTAFANNEKDPQRKALAQASSYYFLGRVDVRVPPAQLKAMIIAQSKAITQANAGQTMTACAQQLQQKQQAMMAIGRELAAMAPKPAAPAK